MEPSINILEVNADIGVTISEPKKKVFITSALPYTNNVPHLGNIIGSVLSADVYARYLRKKGLDVMFVCGVDNYGTSTEIKAIKDGLTCEELCEKYTKIHTEVYKWFNLSFDVFGKTSNTTHTQITQDIFLSLHKKGLLTEKTDEQYFCEQCERFVCDRFIHGTCYMENCRGLVKGDECDKCCKMIDIDKVLNKFCSICTSPPIKRETKHLYFALEPYREQLKKYFLNDESNGVKYLSPSGKRLTKEWLSKDLHERSVTRDLFFGVPLPKFDGLTDYDSKISWPWFDACISYISILAHAHPENWRNWVNPSVDWIQFMAKDNVPFHTIVFPSTLIGSEFESLGLNGKCGVTHLSSTEYLLFDNEKFSKSNGVGIFGNQVMALSKKFEIDEDYWRYYLVKIRPENADSNFDFKGFCDVIKGELAQKIGNLVNRVMAMTKKYYPKQSGLRYDFTDFSTKIKKLREIVQNYIGAFDNFSYHEIIVLINKVAELGNEWINENTIWNICRDEPTKNEHIMGILVFILWLFAELSEPIMPKKSQKIKGHCHVKDIDVNKITTFDKIIEILDSSAGYVEVDHTGTEILFKQIKLEDILA